MKRFGSLFCIMASAFLYGCQPMLLTLVYEYGGNGFSTSCYASLFGSVILAVILLWKRVSLKISRPILQKLLILSLLGNSMTNLLLYFSYMRIASSLATTMHFIYPIVVALAMIVFFRERFAVSKLLALMLAIGGVALISGGVAAEVDALGFFSALASGFTWAFYIVFLEKSGLTQEDSRLVAFYLCLFTAVFCGLVSLISGNLQPLTAPEGWGMMLITAVVGRVLAGPLFQKGIQGSGATVAGLLSTLEPITACFLGWLVLNEQLTYQKIGGITLVLGGVVMIVISQHSPSLQEKTQHLQ